ncbi:MAG: CCA tRNA nucleotidyltransferase [Acidobacteria bacterium]|nr:CCA tRNA nucleotidyltransferase [Acidobacteriota bacterium]
MYKAARRIAKKLRQHGHMALFAGGWVRDSLLNRKSKDIDIATSARPAEVLRLFPNATAVGARFGVIQVRLYGHSYEVATFRSDSAYRDGRHPSSVTFSGPRRDARRRDFTINGLLYDPETGRLIDYVGGKADIKKKRIRTIGDPRERFAEDKLRMLRAVRFSCNLNFRIEKGTWGAILEMAPEILDVSWERIRDELTGILTGAAPGMGLEMLHQSGLLSSIIPEVAAMRGLSAFAGAGCDTFELTARAMSFLRRPSVELAFGVLLHRLGSVSGASSEGSFLPDEAAELGGRRAEKICRRLRLPRHSIESVADLVAGQTQLFKVKNLKKSALKRLLRKPNFDEHMELHRASACSSGIALDNYAFCRRKIEEYAKEPLTAPLLDGEGLIALGYKPGPVFKSILQNIEDLQLEGAIHTKEDAIEHVRRAFPKTN